MQKSVDSGASEVFQQLGALLKNSSPGGSDLSHKRPGPEPGSLTTLSHPHTPVYLQAREKDRKMN